MTDHAQPAVLDHLGRRQHALLDAAGQGQLALHRGLGRLLDHQLTESIGHEVEVARQRADLVTAAIIDALPEIAGGDALGRSRQRAQRPTGADALGRGHHDPDSQ